MKFTSHFFAFAFLIMCLLLNSSCKTESNEPLMFRPGTKITKSVDLLAGTYEFQGQSSIEKPILIIEGNDIELDFHSIFIDGASPGQVPSKFQGLGILVQNGKNITLKNLTIKGYKIALMVKNVENFKLENSDLSYNYRPELKSTRVAEAESDWMSFHDNENGEWLRYGTAAYLDNCKNAIVRNCVIRQGQNALLLVNCKDGKFYNNKFRFNSGLGIGLYRSSNNLIFNNLLDWNIRGFSYGVYNRCQDSAGVLAYEQSSNNTIACNSATHSGDGVFIWAGNQTIESGEGGCTDNKIWANDCSFASNNGIEITFSKGNQVQWNKMEECDYGIWGGYSYEMLIEENLFLQNNHGIAIEHGHLNKIQNNFFDQPKEAISIWERSTQPKSWPFATIRNISNKDNSFTKNTFLNPQRTFVINNSDNTIVKENIIRQPSEEIIIGKANKKLKEEKNIIYKQAINIKSPVFKSSFQKTFDQLKPEPTLKALEWESHLPKGREKILVNEWGPYNFEYPSIWLRSADSEAFNFSLLGPKGNWQVIDVLGFESVSPTRGSLPTSLIAKPKPGAKVYEIKLRFIGPEFVDQFGVYHGKGELYGMIFRENIEGI